MGCEGGDFGEVVMADLKPFADAKPPAAWQEAFAHDREFLTLSESGASPAQEAGEPGQPEALLRHLPDGTVAGKLA
jgi:hypothetical protein